MTEPVSTHVISPGDLPDELWPDDLLRVGQTPVAWLWHGYLKPGTVTLLTSRWKSGKTTLLSVLLARLGSGDVESSRMPSNLPIRVAPTNRQRQYRPA